MKLPESWTTVTSLSKTFALVLIVLLPFIGFFLGVKYGRSNSPMVSFVPSDKTYSPEISPTVVLSQFNLEEMNIIGSWCHSDKSIDQHGGTISRCGSHYQLSSDKPLMDEPTFIYDNQGKRVGGCGGMPLPPWSRKDPLCSSACIEAKQFSCD